MSREAADSSARCRSRQESGLRVNYKGPYDVCCGFLSDSQCTRNDAGAIAVSDCPIDTELVASVTKPLARAEFGHYEATLTIFGTYDGVEIEIACIVLPVVFNDASWNKALHEHKLQTGELSIAEASKEQQQQQQQPPLDDIELPGEDHQKPITFKPERSRHEEQQRQADSLAEPVLLLGS